MPILDLLPDNTAAIHQAARLLVAGFAELSPTSWPDMDSALAEVHDSSGPDRISRIMVDTTHTVRGWIGGIRQYAGHVYELHPLVVCQTCRGQGIGRALVNDLEACVSQRGGRVLWVGTDDEQGWTTLAGVDLFPDALTHLAHIQNLRRHPYEFYQRVGFVLAGVMPDANGPGKPDIYLVKRVTQPG